MALAVFASCFLVTEPRNEAKIDLLCCIEMFFVFQLTSSGAPFWSGPKRCPHPLEFSTSNVSIFLFA